MWPWADWKLRRALRRYRRERDLEAVLRMDWHRDLALNTFFADVEERLHGEEITMPSAAPAPRQSKPRIGFQ